MPAAVDLVLKNAALVDKTFVLYNPSAGDNSLATWKLKEGTISSIFPWITALARQTGNKSRTAQIRFRVPSSYTDTVTGLTQVGSACEVNISVSVPDDFPEAVKADVVAFTGNLVNHALIKSIMRDAIPAT